MSTMTQWKEALSGPSQADNRWKADNHVGKLCIFGNVSRKMVEGKRGPVECASCEFVTVLDDDDKDAADTWFDVRVFTAKLGRQLGSNSTVVGRVYEREPDELYSPNESPFMLDEVTSSDDMKKAAAWLNKNGSVTKSGKISLTMADVERNTVSDGDKDSEEEPW